MKKLLVITTALLLSACTVDHGNFTVISNQVVDTNNIDLQTPNKIKNVEGDSTGHIVILFPVGTMNPNVEDAMRDAFTRVDGDMFVNASVKQSAFYFPYVYGRFNVNITGDVIKTRK